MNKTYSTISQAHVLYYLNFSVLQVVRIYYKCMYKMIPEKSKEEKNQRTTKALRNKTKPIKCKSALEKNWK